MKNEATIGMLLALPFLALGVANGEDISRKTAKLSQDIEQIEKNRFLLTRQFNSLQTHTQLQDL